MYRQVWYKMINKRTGFTLAEVLITLAVIGVLAAMTVPSLMQATQDQELKTSFKKAYSVASRAWKQVVAENPQTYTARGGWPYCTWPNGDTGHFTANDGRADAFKAKFNVIKSCVNQYGCWPSNYESTTGILGTPRNFGWIASDGMCWAVSWKNFDESAIQVDTNCDKGPNLIGKDIFPFMLGVDGIVYFGIDDMSQNGKPLSSGSVCPLLSSPTSINGRTVNLKSWLIN